MQKLHSCFDGPRRLQICFPLVQQRSTLFQVQIRGDLTKGRVVTIGGGNNGPQVYVTHTPKQTLELLGFNQQTLGLLFGPANYRFDAGLPTPSNPTGLTSSVQKAPPTGITEYY